MGSLSKQIYDALVGDQDELAPLEVRDILKNGCSGRSLYHMIGEEKSEARRLTGPDLILLEAHRGFRERFFYSYMEGAFGGQYSRPEPAFSGSVQIHYDGTLAGVPVFLEMRPAANYKLGDLPEWLTRIIAARAWLLGSKDQAYVVVLDQNTQAWNTWHVTGDFSEIGEFTSKEIDYLTRVFSGSADLIGMQSECSICPYEEACDVEDKIPEPGPVPRTSLRVVHDKHLLTELEKHLWELNNKPTGRKTKVISPSEFTGSSHGKACDRAIAYGLMGIQKKTKIDPKLRRIFDMGHCVHDVVQDTLAWLHGNDLQLEVPINHGDLPFHGSCDFKLVDVAGEIKSISEKGAAKLTKPKSEHEDQAHIYAIAPQVDCQTIVYLYVNKNTGEITLFEKKTNRRRWHKLAGRAGRITHAVHEGDLPDQINKAYICGGCPFEWYCNPQIDGNKRRFRR